MRVGEGAWTGSYSFASRFEDGAGTNPEELIAAAHAGIDLDTEADAPGLDETRFREPAETAKAACAVSRALPGVETISLTSATLLDG